MKNCLHFTRILFVIFVLGITLFSGCGKDDKETSSPQPIYPFTTQYVIESSYLNACPSSPNASNDSTGIILTWTAPSVTPLPNGYNVYQLPGVTGSPAVLVGTTKDLTFTDTTALTKNVSYFYYVKSVFTLFDSTYAFNIYLVESKPSEIVSRVKL